MLSKIQEIIDSTWELTGAERKTLLEIQGKDVIQKTNIITSGKYLLYKFEKNGNIDIPYLSNKKDVKKIADYVLFTEKDEKLFVLVFELKNGKGNPIKQIHATKILSQYLIETTKRVCHIEYDKIEYRGIGITNKAVKRNTKPNNIYNHNYYTQLSSQSAIDINSLCI